MLLKYINNFINKNEFEIFLCFSGVFLYSHAF